MNKVLGLLNISTIEFEFQEVSIVDISSELLSMSYEAFFGTTLSTIREVTFKNMDLNLQHLI